MGKRAQEVGAVVLVALALVIMVATWQKEPHYFIKYDPTTQSCNVYEANSHTMELVPVQLDIPCQRAKEWYQGADMPQWLREAE